MKTPSKTAEVLMNSRYLIEGEEWTDLAKRVGTAIAQAEKTPALQEEWAKKFTEIIQKGEFIPASPFLMNAGVNNHLFSCYVLPIKDSLAHIYETIADAAKIFQVAGGVGYEFSSLRPKGCFTTKSGGVSSGPVSFMRVFDASCNELKAGGRRKGAQMGTFRIDHPDIEEFINVKQDLSQLTNFNLSVTLTEAFMQAVHDNGSIMLQFKGQPQADREIQAKVLWEQIIENAWKCGEPGILFIDRINDKDPIGNITATNPCGEVPMPPYGCCDLGSIDLAKLFTRGKFDWTRYENLIEIAVRFLDDAIDINYYTLPQIKEQQLSERRIGLGIMGLADAFVKLGLAYDSSEACAISEDFARTLKDTAKATSEALALEKGAFPSQNLSKIKDSAPIRNATCTTIAPTGCLVPSTRVYSNKGCPRIGDLPFSKTTKTFLDVDYLNVSTDMGVEVSTKTYNNGIASTVKITTKRGFELEGTESHQIRVINDQGKYVWKKLKELQIGDLPCLAKGTAYDFPAHNVQLVPTEKLHFNADPNTKLPGELTPKVAYILGFFVGDGNFASEGVRFAFNLDEPDEIARIANVIDDVFGLSFWGATLPIGKGICYCLNSRPVKRWLYQFGCTNTGTKLQVPQQIWDSPAEVKGAFLRGLYDADGSASIHSRKIELNSHNQQFLKEIQRLILDLGIMSGFNSWIRGESCFSSGTMYKISITHQADIILFSQIIGFDHMGKGQTLAKIIESYTTSPRKYDNQPNLPEELDTSRIYVDKIVSIAYGESQTYDIEVPNGNAYIANGFVSHNSISIVAGCSSGIEPIYALTIERRHNLPGFEVIWEENELFVDIAKKQGFYSKALIEKIKKNSGSCQGIDEVPKDIQAIFKIAADITPINHISQLAVWQKFIDSAVSKTINLAASATQEDVGEIFWMAYEGGCKGITVFRDGCRGSQVLSSGAKKETRPDIIEGKIIRVPTSLGKMYVTVGIVDDQPFEVFVSLSQPGTNAFADAEALGRMVSLALRTKISVLEIVKQLKGIGAGSSSFHKGRAITSIPDAIAFALEKYFLDVKVAHPDDHAQFASGTEGAYCRDCDEE
ncbi:hypothetical protein LCGC14_1039450 [marine sediment metagenome]|uniref:Vitamin B12-dependent ribonucleotide reductase n=1 Tax=marine sediment metagenome TaxID=412755 RepID=A0A0F9NDV1_9ZZZZ